MSYKIKLGTFKKFVESTKQPNTSAWAEYDVVFKDGADIVNPIITLAIDYSTVSAYNYAYMLNRYYWITAKNMLCSGYCVLSLKTDVLATYKSAIGNSDLYILRSSAQSDGAIVDRFYPQTADKTVSTVAFENFPNVGFSGGYYVVNVAGKGNNGTSTLYSFTPAQFSTLIGQLLGTVDTAQQGLTGDWLGVVEAISNTIFEPINYINSVMWYPFQFSGTDYSTGTLFYIGKWSSGVAHRIINNPVKTVHNETITIPKHPKASSRGKYLNLAPYSQYQIEYDPFGAFTLDSSQLINETELRAALYADALTGTGTLKIRGNTGTSCLATINTQIGVQLPITVAGLAAGTLSSAVSVIGSAAMTGGAAAAIAGAAMAGIDTAAGSITGSVSSIGSQGSILAYQLPKGLTATFYDIVDEDNTRNGRPLCKVKKPSTLTGFMIASRGDVDISGTLPEEEEIRRYLESGFFYE